VDKPIALRAALAAFLLPAVPALATVNHGDFLGTSVDFIAVSETTLSVGDAEPLWGAPALAGSGDQLVFFPPAFISQCTLGGSDVTQSELTTNITAHSGGSIETIMLAENGDVTLTSFPPFGTAATNASAALSGTVTVTETTSGPITPVVIPFTGTFTPAGSFALPIDFGTKLWSGSISIDVASAVPGATVAVLTLDNNLAANCGPGNSGAKIQKKVVSGPSVAILVNPVECDLQVDKTCCITQPVLPDLDSCDGKLTKLTLEYTGDKCSHSNNEQGGKFDCYGKRSIGEPANVNVLGPGVVATPNADLEFGDTLELTPTGSYFPSKTKLKVSDSWWRRQYLKIDTSCERAIGCGDKFGAFKVTGVESTLGGVVDCNAPPPEPECAPSGDPVGTPCDDKVVDIVFEYHGKACQNPLPNPQGGFADCWGDATGATNVGIVYSGPNASKQKISPSSGINDGDRIRVTATSQGGCQELQSYKITTSSGIKQRIDMKVSCTQPFRLGDEFGSLRVVEFTTKSGFHAALGSGDPGPFDACEVPLAPPGPHCTSDLQGLTLAYIGNYLGQGCSVSNPQGGYGTCSGVADPGSLVGVSIEPGLTADPPDQIEFGDLVTITSTDDGDLPGLTNLTVTGENGSQTIQIKTSCYKPLSLGDLFGSFVVFGMDREEEGPISIGGNIQYQYKVTNPNESTVDNVEITDDQLGVIATGQSIPPGGSLTFKKPATLFGTTTNVATATGDVGGDMCTPGTDTVTVGVRAPLQGSFSCSDPIKKLTLIWNGAQTVDVKVWKNAPNTSTLLNLFDNLAPGATINAEGFQAGSQTAVFEIFDSTGTTKLGESKFDLSCQDSSMNSLEDCGKNNGNLKYNYGSLINDWLLEGLVDTNETLNCTPDLVAAPPSCGLGPELIVLMPGLLWLHRRRLRKAE
jgi:hypothetical protein